MARKMVQTYTVDINDGAISLSLTYDPVELVTLLKGFARYYEVRKQLKRKRPNKTVRLVNVSDDLVSSRTQECHYLKYVVSFEKGDIHLKNIPLSQLPDFAEKLGLYTHQDETQFTVEALKAEEFIHAEATEKLRLSFEQFLFEALHAATGLPVPQGKRRELERIGTLAGKCEALRMVGRYTPADLRRRDKRELEEWIKIAVLVLEKRVKSITYDEVAKFLQSQFEYNPVLTGENLRKAVSHHGLNWKKLKKRKT